MPEKKKIGILGGTFDPFHRGHFLIAWHLKRIIQLNRVYFVPTRRNPLKSEDSLNATADQRLAMLYLQTQSSHGMYVETFEIDRGRESGQPSYTIDTLEYFKGKFPDHDLVLIIGSDNTMLHQWRDIGQFPEYLEKIAVISRPDHSTVENKFTNEIEILKEKFPDVFKLIEFFPFAKYDISATDIRKSLSEGKIPDGALYPQIELFIRKYGLYGYKETDDKS